MITDLTTAYSTTSTTSTTTTTDSEDDNTSMTTEDFINIMVEELTNQDPTSPTDTSAYVSELAQLQSIEASEAQTEAMENMSEQLDCMSELMNGMVYDSSFQNACTLIGTEVTGVDDDGVTIAGTVESVQSDGDTISMMLSNGYSIDYSNLSEVS